jgi:hypothetical protein
VEKQFWSAAIDRRFAFFSFSRGDGMQRGKGEKSKAAVNRRTPK